MDRNRRRLALGIASALVAPRAIAARPKRVVLILRSDTGSSGAVRQHTIDILRGEGLVHGRDFEVEIVDTYVRSGDMGRLADEVVASGPDVIGVSGTADTQLFAARTRTIPIVFRAVADPVAAGLVSSLARPGGNITGESNLAFELEGKRLAILRELRPDLKHVLVVDVDGTPASLAAVRQQAAARELGLTLERLTLRRMHVREDIGSIPKHLAASRAQAALISAFDFLGAEGRGVLAVLESQRVPAIFLDNRIVQAGGLASLGQRVDRADPTPLRIIARVLRGENPANIPVAQTTRTHFALNLRTARAMNLAIPNSIQLRADELVE
jgi:putative ABC transport system substrate-binding protein